MYKVTNMADITTWRIRPYQVADREQLSAVINAVCREGAWTYTTQFEPTATWEHALSEPTSVNHLLLVVTHQEEVIGWSELFPTEVKGEVELGIGLLPRARDQGIGTELLCYALQWVQANRIHTIRLIVRADNERAIHLYKKFGFVVQDEVLPPASAGGRWLEMVRATPVDGTHHDRSLRG